MRENEVWKEGREEKGPERGERSMDRREERNREDDAGNASRGKKGKGKYWKNMEILEMERN